MIKSDFTEYRDNLFERCRELNKSKGEDYTKGNSDALANFKEGSQLGIPPMKVCAMFTKKHLDAIFNYVRTDGQSESEPFQERIADAINYLTLLGALDKEAKDKEELDRKNRIEYHKVENPHND